jgi:hypothetical protein
MRRYDDYDQIGGVRMKKLWIKNNMVSFVVALVAFFAFFVLLTPSIYSTMPCGYEGGCLSVFHNEIPGVGGFCTLANCNSYSVVNDCSPGFSPYTGESGRWWDTSITGCDQCTGGIKQCRTHQGGSLIDCCSCMKTTYPGSSCADLGGQGCASNFDDDSMNYISADADNWCLWYYGVYDSGIDAYCIDYPICVKCKNGYIWNGSECAGLEQIKVLDLHLNEGQGSIAHDSSLYGNNGKINGAGWVTGYSGYALSFDGGDDRVEVSDANSLDVSHGLTISAWIKFTSALDHGSGTIIKKDGAYILRFGRNPTRLRGIIFENGTEAIRIINSNKTNWNIGEWYHIAFMYDKNNMKLYINDILDSSQPLTASIKASNYNLSIGNGYYTGDWIEGFPGVIDEVKIYNEATCQGICPDNLPYCNTATNECEAKCADGTPFGQCSSNKPKYCHNGHLEENCLICGCPSEKSYCCPSGVCVQQGARCPSRVVWDLAI